MYVHGIDMYITHYVHTMSVRVYDMFVIFGFGIYMSTHIVKFTYMSATCLATSIVKDMYIPCMYTFKFKFLPVPGGQDSRCTQHFQLGCHGVTGCRVTVMPVSS